MNTPLWLENLLSDPTTTDICLNGDKEVFVDQGAGLIRHEAGSPSNNLWVPDSAAGLNSCEPLKSWVLARLSEAGKTWDARMPFTDVSLKTGHRMHVCFQPVAKNGILVSLRKLSSQKGDSEGAQRRWGRSAFFPKLTEIIRRGESLIISGSTGSGKTTLASDLLSFVPKQERILALEDTPELSPDHPHFLSLISRPPNADSCGEISLRTLLKQTLRMRPDRIVLGECRGEEVLDLLQALNTGHRGALATLHANSPRDALRRIELLCWLSSTQIPNSAIRELLCSGIQWIVQVVRQGQKREIIELHEISGREGDTILMRPWRTLAAVP